MKILIFTILFTAMLTFVATKSVIKPELIVSSDIESIEDLLPNITSGGCGVFAYHLYNRLDKTEKGRYHLMNMDEGRHFLIYDKKKQVYIDPTGVKDDLALYLGWEFETLEPISADDLLKRIKLKKHWGEAYSRENIRKIYNYVQSL